MEKKWAVVDVYGKETKSAYRYAKTSSQNKEWEISLACYSAPFQKVKVIIPANGLSEKEKDQLADWSDVFFEYYREYWENNQMSPFEVYEEARDKAALEAERWLARYFCLDE